MLAFLFRIVIVYLMDITHISRYNISYIGIYINYRVFFLKKVIEKNSISH